VHGPLSKAHACNGRHQQPSTLSDATQSVPDAPWTTTIPLFTPQQTLFDLKPGGTHKLGSLHNHPAACIRLLACLNQFPLIPIHDWSTNQLQHIMYEHNLKHNNSNGYVHRLQCMLVSVRYPTNMHFILIKHLSSTMQSIAYW